MSPDTVQTSISRALAGLATERSRLDDAIATLQSSIRELATLMRRLAREPVPRVTGGRRAARKSPHWSPAARRAAAARMRRVWAARRKARPRRKPARKPERRAVSAPRPRSADRPPAESR